jgi:regulator of sirC expression with transglutaminase-like and TPR domain
MLRVSALSDDMIEKIVTLIDRQTKYSDVSKYNTNEEIDDLISHFEESCKVKTDMTKQPHWREEFDEFLDDFFNKFRFKPKEEDVDKYKKYGYKPVEDLELNGLLDQSRLL